jgi:flagellar motor switch/type III secretory pathway protein FliN
MSDMDAQVRDAAKNFEFNALLPDAVQHDLLSETTGSAQVLARGARPASFPNVSHLDPDLIGEMSVGVRKWLELLVRNLSRHIRVSCTFSSVENETVSHTQVPPKDEVAYWGEIEGHPNNLIAISLPSAFAASFCERFFGAPLAVSEPRALTDIESKVMLDLCGEWMGLFRNAWEGVCVQLDRGEDEKDNRNSASCHWVMFKSDLNCGQVNGAIRVFMTGATARLLLGHTPHAGAGRITPDAVLGALGEVPLEIQAVLGRSEFTLDDLVGLRVGDVVTLDRRSYDPIEIVIDNRSAFNARASLAGQMVALDLISAACQEKSQ